MSDVNLNIAVDCKVQSKTVSDEKNEETDKTEDEHNSDDGHGHSHDEHSSSSANIALSALVGFFTLSYLL